MCSAGPGRGGVLGVPLGHEAVLTLGAAEGAQVGAKLVGGEAARARTYKKPEDKRTSES